MAIIRNITTANTFQQHVTVAETVQKLNHLTDGTSTGTGKFFANTDILIDGNLDVTGNISLDAACFDNLTMNGNLILTIKVIFIYNSCKHFRHAKNSMKSMQIVEIFFCNSHNTKNKTTFIFQTRFYLCFDLQSLIDQSPVCNS